MELKELKKLIQSGESETLEFKKSTGQLMRAGETLSAFLNHKGGQVVIGVTPAGKISGQLVSDTTLRDIAAILEKFEPPVRIIIDRIPLDDGKEIIALGASVSSGSAPFTFNGRAYRRVGSTTAAMPQEQYQRQLLYRAHSHSRWESDPALSMQISGLDRDEILRTVRLGIEAGRLPESTGSDPADILNRLGLRREGRILNAAVVLFGTSFLPDYPQCQLRLARFKGADKAEFLDNRQLHGNAFQLLDEAMSFLLRHLPIAGRFESGRMERIDEPLFPVAALREALVNAFCHRDYTITGGSVSVAIFDNRLEIWSDGTLPFGLTLVDLKRNHRSLPRNQLVADTFFRRRLVERWGRGTQMIVELCIKAGHPEPEFVEETGAFGVRFLPSAYIAPRRVAHDLTERQREILQLLAGAQEINFARVRQILRSAPSDRSIRNDLIQLRQLGLIELDGRGRSARWFLTRKNDE
ncbi:MAG: transcriptional regulator [Deltaproteobacteria bacterium RIFOXYD12_FULL_50_9]|nr:MAG: transcriptional regulator [Deltaproteobacteria bacterium RIFOXYD12_FULL_50_9]